MRVEELLDLAGRSKLTGEYKKIEPKCWKGVRGSGCYAPHFLVVNEEWKWYNQIYNRNFDKGTG